jgi:hypothetical protein
VILLGRRVDGIGSLVLLQDRQGDLRIVVRDNVPGRSFTFDTDREQAYSDYYHPYLQAPASVLELVNRRPCMDDTIEEPNENSILLGPDPQLTL